MDNSGGRVWMNVWKVGRTVENGTLAAAGDPIAVENDNARHTLRCDGRREGRWADYRQRVVMRNPTNMMPKPITMFHEPSDGTGSVVFEM